MRDREDKWGSSCTAVGVDSGLRDGTTLPGPLAMSLITDSMGTVSSYLSCLAADNSVNMLLQE